MTPCVADHGSELKRLNEEVQECSVNDCRLAQPKFYLNKSHFPLPVCLWRSKTREQRHCTRDEVNSEDLDQPVAFSSCSLEKSIESRNTVPSAITNWKSFLLKPSSITKHKLGKQKLYKALNNSVFYFSPICKFKAICMKCCMVGFSVWLGLFCWFLLLFSCCFVL